jgi:hypothetical protein
MVLKKAVSSTIREKCNARIDRSYRLLAVAFAEVKNERTSPRGFIEHSIFMISLVTFDVLYFGCRCLERLTYIELT